MDSYELALWALIVACGSLAITFAALLVAYLDWRQVGREEPWKLTKVGETVWLLERVHRGRVIIVDIGNFHGSPVDVCNDAGFAAQAFRRGSKEVLTLERNDLGTELTVFYRKAMPWERHSTGPAHEGAQFVRGVKTWGSPIY